MPLYLPPTPGAILQGDIFSNLPSVYVAARPLRAARSYKPPKKPGERDLWGVHTEGAAAPADGFKWTIAQGGEAATLVHGYLGMAMVLSHDCEIENDPHARTLAMIRPITDLDEHTQEQLFSGNEEDVIYTAFPLEAQEEEPTMSRAFVDFRRLTTVKPAVLEAGTRLASVSDELRIAVTERFWDYLFRPPPLAEND